MTKPGDDTSGLRRRTFLATSAAAVGAVGTASVIEAAAAGQPVEAEPHAPAKRPYNGPYVRRAPEPRRLPPRRDRRRHDLPRRHRLPLARLAPPQARRLQRAVRLRGAARQGLARHGPRARRPGAGLEALRRQGRRQRPRRCLVRPAAVPRGELPRALPVRHGHPGRPQGAAAGGDHRLEPVRAGRRRRLVACRSPRSSTASRTRATAPGGGLLLERAQLHGGRKANEGGARGAGRVRALGRRAGRTRRGKRRASASGRRPGGEGQPRLVPRRLVRPADAGVEGRRRGRVLRAPGRDRGRARARARRSSCRSPSRPAQRRRSPCGWRGTSGRRTCASARIAWRWPDAAAAGTYRPWYAGRFCSIDEVDRLLARALRDAAREGGRASATASTTRRCRRR